MACPECQHPYRKLIMSGHDLPDEPRQKEAWKCLNPECEFIDFDVELDQNDVDDFDEP